MEKLRIKLLIIIFGMLSIFNVIFMGYILVGEYNDTYEDVQDVFDAAQSQLNDSSGTLDYNDLHEENVTDDDESLVYVDYEVKIALIDQEEQQDYFSGESRSEKHFDINEATEQIKSSQKSKYIGNLYKSVYAYEVINDKIVIVCTKIASQKLVRETWNQLLVSLVIEIIAFVFSKWLVRSLIEPVRESFIKQKQFVADASHELKTPLAVIMASCEALESEPEELKWLYNIENESERMNSLIIEMLDLAKMDSGQHELVLEEVNLSKLVEKEILTDEALLFEKNILLEDNIENNIIVKANSNSIKQVITILIDNATKYADTKIVVSLKKGKKNIILKVCNDGEKINDDETSKIFERFYKSDRSRNRDDNHYGLGLAIAKSIIEAHHGTIKAYSRDGLTTFEIQLRMLK